MHGSDANAGLLGVVGFVAAHALDGQTGALKRLGIGVGEAVRVSDEADFARRAVFGRVGCREGVDVLGDLAAFVREEGATVDLRSRAVAGVRRSSDSMKSFDFTKLFESSATSRVSSRRRISILSSYAVRNRFFPRMMMQVSAS